MDIPKTGKVSVVIDSDAYNEIDDQFAIAWALLHPERIDLQAIYAAPYTNNFFEEEEQSERTVCSAKEGMELSFDEVHRVLDLLPDTVHPEVFKGSTSYFKDSLKPERSPAVNDLIARARACDDTLHVLCIAAPTNIAHAIALAPDLIDKIHVIWLGGHSFDWENTEEFNLMQDIKASQLMFDSGVALTLFPCMGVTNTLATSIPEISYYLEDSSKIGSYLANLAPKFPWISFASRKVIWDIANVGLVLNSDWFTYDLVSSPILNENLTWSFNNKRHVIKVIKYIARDNLFKDLFKTLIDADK